MELVAALKLIEQENPFVRDEEGGFHWGELADGNFAVGRCSVASWYLRDRLKDLGVNAWLTCEPDPMTPWMNPAAGHSAEQLGIEVIRPGYAKHLAIYAYDPQTGVCLIDYTATQYGERAWPLILSGESLTGDRELPARHASTAA